MTARPCGSGGSPSRRRAGLLSALLLAVGCFRYVPSTAAEAAPGAELRLRLTEAGAARLAPVLGPQALTLEGRLLGSSDTALVLAVTGLTRQGSSATSWAGDSVAVPRDAIASAERRVLDPGRTVATIAVGIAAAALTGRLARGAGGTNQGGDPTPVPPSP